MWNVHIYPQLSWYGENYCFWNKLETNFIGCPTNTLWHQICHYSDNRSKDMGSRVFSATGHLKKPQKQTCFFLIQSVISLDKCSYMTLRYFHIRGDFCIMSQRRIFWAYLPYYIWIYESMTKGYLFILTLLGYISAGSEPEQGPVKCPA